MMDSSVGLLELPYELLLKIMSHLHESDLLGSRLVCSSMDCVSREYMKSALLDLSGAWTASAGFPVAAGYFFGVQVASRTPHMRTRISRTGITSLAGINTIKVLYLMDIWWDRNLVESFFTVLSSFSCLKLLNLNSHLCTFKPCLMGSFGVKGIEYLCTELEQLRNLRVLQLESVGMGNKGAELLASSLPHLQRLKILSLANNYIGDRGMKVLARCFPKLSSLEELCLSFNSMHDTGMKHLTACLPFILCLKHLELLGSKIYEKGLIAFIGSFPYLQELSSFWISVHDRNVPASTATLFRQAWKIMVATLSLPINRIELPPAPMDLRGKWAVGQLRNFIEKGMLAIDLEEMEGGRKLCAIRFSIAGV